jgi:group I intron endonuclease
MASVYYIECKTNGKKYIGACLDFQNRIKGHLYDFSKQRNNINAQNDFNKYGIENFIIKEIEHLEDNIQLLIERENYWMDYYKTFIPTYGNEFGYNLRRSNIPSFEAREKMSLSKKGKDNPNYGNEIPLEVKEKISNSNKGKHNGENNANNKIKFEDAEKIFNYLKNKDKTIKELALEYGVCEHTIGAIKNGNHCFSDKLGNLKKEKQEKEIKNAINIKQFILENINKLPFYQIQEIASEKFNCSKKMILRIKYGEYKLSKVLGGGLKDWLEVNNNGY